MPLPADEPFPGVQEGEILSLGVSRRHHDSSLPSPLRTPRPPRAVLPPPGAAAEPPELSSGAGAAVPTAAAGGWLPSRGRGAEQAPLPIPPPRFIPGAGRSLPALPPALVPSPQPRDAEEGPAWRGAAGVPVPERWGCPRRGRRGRCSPPLPSRRGAAWATASGGRWARLRETRLPSTDLPSSRS